MAGINALTHVVHLCEARLLLLEEKYEEGISKLQSVRNAAPYGEYNFNQSLIDLEIEYCRHRLKPNEARSSNPKWDFDALDIDEQMLAAWMIGEIYSNSSEASEVEGIDRRLTEKKIGYSRTLTELRSILEAFADA